MTTVRIKTTMTTRGESCYIAWIQHVAKSGQYATRVGALRSLCEVLANKLVEQKRTDYPFIATGPCECEGWGTPTGCPGCGIRCMGG